VTQAIQRSRCTLSLLEETIHTVQRQRTAAVRYVALEIIAGIRSVEEGALRWELLRAGLPEPHWNVDLYTLDGKFICSPDGWYAAGVALEVNSRKYHLDPESWEATQERWSRMARLDITVIPVTPQRRRRDSPGLMSDIRAALDSASLRPPPRVTFKRRSQAA